MREFRIKLFKKVLIILFLYTFLLMVFNLNVLNLKNFLISRINTVNLENKFTINEKRAKKCEKWIIMTTINHATEHVKYVSDASYGWCVLVVGDKKTPDSWSYKEVFFLDIKDQIELSKKYKIINQIPFNSYSRKMIAYLYAIELKAKYIYETDDDNSPLDGLFGFRYEKFYGLESSCNENNLFINPYNYFGQPSVWPRYFSFIKF